MSARSFGALIAHDGVCLVEYRAERTGIRIIEQWADTGRSASIDEALVGCWRFSMLVNSRAQKSPWRSSIRRHSSRMTLPNAADNVLQPIIQREVQRVFGLANPVVAFSRSRCRSGVVTRRRLIAIGARQIFMLRRYSRRSVRSAQLGTSRPRSGHRRSQGDP